MNIEDIVKNLEEQKVQLWSLEEEGYPKVNQKVAGVVPMASEKDQQVITNSLRDGVQTTPILLWRNEVVDGRCRLRGLKEAKNKDVVKYKVIPDDVDENSVMSYIISIHTRRHLSTTQKVCSIAKIYCEGLTVLSIGALASSNNMGEKLVKNSVWLYRNEPDVFIKLFNNEGVQIVDKNGEVVFVNKVTPVYRHFKGLKDKATVDAETGMFSSLEEGAYLQEGLGVDLSDVEFLNVAGKKFKTDSQMLPFSVFVDKYSKVLQRLSDYIVATEEKDSVKVV